jgi:hypothetical protein
LFIVGGIVFLLLAALFLVAPRLLPGDMIRDEIIRGVEDATGARVTLGEAKLRWNRGWSVTLREGTISGTGAALAAATGSANDIESYAVEIGELSVAPALLPLIRKQLVIKSVQLAGPRLDVRWRNGEAEATGLSVRITDLNLGLAQSGTPIPADLSLAFRVLADTLVLEGIPYTGLDMKGGYTEKVLEVTALSARRSSGTLKGTFVVDFTRNPGGHLDFEAEADQVPAEALLVEWAPDIGQRLDCGLDARVAGGFDLGDDATVQRTLDISGVMTATEGVLHASDWLEDVSRYLGKRQDLKDVRFSSLRHEFRMTGGRYLVDELIIGGGDTDWRGTGWLEPKGAIALDVDVKLPPGFTPDLGNWSFLAKSLRDADGRINLPLKLSGRAARPTVGVDLGRLQPQ